MKEKGWTSEVTVRQEQFCSGTITLPLQLNQSTLWNLQKEEIIANMERRKEQLQRMLEESKDKLTRHLAGEHVFEDDEVRQ